MHRTTRRAWSGALALLCLLGAASTWAQDRVTIRFRPLPGQQIESTSEDDTHMQMRVLDDRGIGKKFAANGVRLPLDLSMRERSRFQLLAEAAAADGSFGLEMAYLEKSTQLKLPDGRLQKLPDRSPLMGARASARMGPTGALLPGSVRLQGGPPDEATQAAVLGVLKAMLETLAQLEDVEVGGQVASPQRVQIPLPLPGIGQLNLDMLILYRLLGMRDGVADIESIYTLSMKSPSAGLKLSMNGGGGGRMRYEPATRLVRDQTNHMTVTMEIDGPDGRIGFNLRTQQSIASRALDGKR